MMSSTAGNGGRVELSALMEGRSDASSVADFSRIVSGEMLRSALGNDDDGDDGLRRVAEENQDFRSLANMSLKSLSPSSSPSRGGVQRNATLTVDESGFLALSSHEEAQASLREEVEVEDDVYNTNTKWFGLSFRSRNVERAFLNGHATMHRRIVYKGYGLQICEFSRPTGSASASLSLSPPPRSGRPLLTPFLSFGSRAPRCRHILRHPIPLG